MSGHVGSQLEDQIAKEQIVEISRYLVSGGNQPDLREVSNMLEDFAKNCWLRGYNAKKSDPKPRGE